jgi:hypothetical protein
MIELAVLIAIIVGLWKFSGSINEISDVAEEASRGFTEEKLTEYALEREDRVKELTKEMKERNISEFTSHEKYMTKLGYKSK